jgi:DHA1 family bicyclomycin/chloramphenicol resistance-like MFS transporter
VALALFLGGSLCTLVAQSFDVMLLGRLLQGLGSGGCFTLGTAIIFDAFAAQKAVRAINWLNSVVPFIMAAAPLLGGYLNHVFGFRSNFLAIALLVLLSFLICLFFFKESLPAEKRAPLQLRKVAADFKRTFTCLPFWTLTAVISLLFSGYMVFLSGSSVLFVMEMGVSKQQLPFYQVALLGVWLVASLTCSRALSYFGALRLKKIGAALIGTGAVLVGLAGLMAAENPLTLTVGMMLYSFGVNWVQGLYFPESMELMPDIKGVTASVLTSVRLLLTSVVVEVASSYYNATIYPLVIAIVGVIALALPLILYYEKNRRPQSTLEVQG